MRFLATLRALFHLPSLPPDRGIRDVTRHVHTRPPRPGLHHDSQEDQPPGDDLDGTLIRSDGPVAMAVDSIGIKAHNGGDWMTDKKDDVGDEEGLPEAAREDKAGGLDGDEWGMGGRMMMRALVGSRST